MQTIRRSDQRGVANFGWLDSRHTFSFGHYFDQNHMGFGPLRVINEDRVKPAQGFDVVSGALQHQDSMGNGSVIRPGDVQRMSAGTGVRHSEYNASSDEDVHFLQIWIIPEEAGLAPGYEEKTFSEADKHNQLRLVGSRDGREGSITIHQDVDLYVGVLDAGLEVSHSFAEGRRAWLQVVHGGVDANGADLAAGDGLPLSEPGQLDLRVTSDAEVLLFDMS
jgi:redox-sensitive bicupin YhaK (pirin superfamily)